VPEFVAWDEIPVQHGGYQNFPRGIKEGTHQKLFQANANGRPRRALNHGGSFQFEIVIEIRQDFDRQV
jgi:hypothetical protein